MLEVLWEKLLLTYPLPRLLIKGVDLLCKRVNWGTETFHHTLKITGLVNAGGWNKCTSVSSSGTTAPPFLPSSHHSVWFLSERKQHHVKCLLVTKFPFAEWTFHTIAGRDQYGRGMSYEYKERLVFSGLTKLFPSLRVCLQTQPLSHNEPWSWMDRRDAAGNQLGSLENLLALLS